MLYLSFLSNRPWFWFGHRLYPGGSHLLYALGTLASLNLPIVGEFIAEIARIVQNELAVRP